MDVESYYRSIRSELDALRDRVRFLIGDRHWPTDGGWKESVLRAAIRTHLGRGTGIAHGFVANGEDVSPQVDIILYRADAPLLFQDGNLAIVPTEAVTGIIEVKSRLNGRTLREGLEHL